MMLPSQRHLFDVPEEICYLNCAYMSPQLHSVHKAGKEAISLKSHPWRVKPEDFFTESEKARSRFAAICGADANNIAIIPAVSYGMSVASTNVAVGEGRRILVLDEQFPSNVYPWRELAKERGAQLVTVARPADHDWTSAVLEELNGHTDLVAVPNCHWTDGSVLDLERVGERAREVGAALVVDATQSLGAHPLDVGRVKPDFLISAGYKWLLGPYSLGFMYVDEKHWAGKPVEHNWILRKGSEDFSGLVEYRDGFQPGARRYDVGERSNFVLLPMANAAMEQVLDWGVANISETLGKLTDHVEKRAAEHGIGTIPTERRARHMTGLHLGPGAPQDLAARLAAENVFVSVRGESVRVSPHLYNTEADVNRLFEALDSIF